MIHICRLHIFQDISEKPEAINNNYPWDAGSVVYKKIHPAPYIPHVCPERRMVDNKNLIFLNLICLCYFYIDFNATKVIRSSVNTFVNDVCNKFIAHIINKIFEKCSTKYNFQPIVGVHI